MQGLSNLFDDLLGNLELIALSLAIGGVVWSLFVLRVWKPLSAQEKIIAARSIKLILIGAAGLAIMQVVHIASKVSLLSSILDQPISAFFQTMQFQAGLVRAAIAAGMAFCVLWLRRDPEAKERWAATAVFAVLLGISGAWLTHATGRFEDRAQLMAWTAVHQMGAALWVGGVIQFGALWHLARQREDMQVLWGELLKRFSVIGITAVVVLVITGSTLAWQYVATLQGLIGTAYGSLVVIKVVLLVTALGLAGLNFHAAKRWKQNGMRDIFTKIPYFIEAETVILVVILLVAASLSSQPPAVDVMNQSATWAEVAEAFSPKWPHLTSPSQDKVLSEREDRLSLVETGRAELDWSDFNHNVAGVILVVIGAMALIARRNRNSWAQHWPLGFAVLAGFLFFRSDPETWPFGPVGFWESTFGAAEVLQHRLSLLVALVLGIIEWRARTADASRTRLPYFFPVLCLTGGALLLTHSHQVFEIKQAYLIEVSHSWIGLLAVIMACGRWLELRFTPTDGQAPAAARAGGYLAIAAMMLIGMVLISYREQPPPQVHETPLETQQADVNG